MITNLSVSYIVYYSVVRYHNPCVGGYGDCWCRAVRVAMASKPAYAVQNQLDGIQKGTVTYTRPSAKSKASP